MSVHTVDKPEDKRENLKRIREYHRPTLEALGIPESQLIAKMAYIPHGQTERHIAFFESEINKGEDVYVEFADKMNMPENIPGYAPRSIVKWKFNPHYAEEYQKTDPHPSTGHVRFLVPIGELVVIQPPTVTTEVVTKEVAEVDEKIDFELPDPEIDLPLDQMTIRDLAAILLKKPCSTKKWLNEIISSK